MNKTLLLFALPLIAAAAVPAAAQMGPSKVATATAAVSPAAVAPGGKGTLRVTLSVKPLYHVNANKPNDPAYIPTVFTPTPTPGIVYGAAHYPAPKLVKVSYSPKPLLVYTGTVVVSVPFTVVRSAKHGISPLGGSLDFQGCDAKSCFPPASAAVKAPLTVK